MKGTKRRISQIVTLIHSYVDFSHSSYAEEEEEEEVVDRTVNKRRRGR